jgi:hypothetical protein
VAPTGISSIATYTVRDLAELWNVREVTVRDWVRCSGVPHVRLRTGRGTTTRMILTHDSALAVLRHALPELFFSERSDRTDCRGCRCPCHHRRDRKPDHK